MRDQAARNSELGHRLGETQRALANSQRGNEMLSSFLVILPDVVRRLNAGTSTRSIPPLLLSSLDQIFEPAKILIYTMRVEGELVLASCKGLSDDKIKGQRLKIGRGQIGLAARHQITMDRNDLAAATSQRRFSRTLSDLKFDLIAPMVHRGRTLGVLAVAGIRRPLRDQKRVIKLVADLGALALINSEHVIRLQNLANRDSLTSLSTKRFLLWKLGNLVHDCRRLPCSLSVIMFDIDHFKRINDTHGHLVGDQILKTVAGIIRGQLRRDDVPGRYGGEEFVVVLPSTAKQNAVEIAEKIRAAIEAQDFSRFAHLPERSVNVTISAGVAELGQDGKGSKDVLSAADQALYRAKAQGRNRVVAFRSRYLSEDPDEQEAVGYTRRNS